VIRQVHLDYLEASADVVTSASYQASFEGFAQRGLNQKQAAELMRLSVRLAREARDQFLSAAPRTGSRDALKPLVAASVGCYGAVLHDGSEYRGDYGLTFQELVDWHRPRLEVLATSGADLLAFETIPCLAEAEALVRLLEDFPPIPAWLAFSCLDAERVCHGEPLTECVAAADHCGNILAVGVNCTPPQLVEELLRRITGQTSKLLLAYPNSGEAWDAKGRCWLPMASPPNWREAARRWHAAGARLIGGCCRTTAATIAQFAGAFGRGAPAR